jgi:hypothetical protein
MLFLLDKFCILDVWNTGKTESGHGKYCRFVLGANKGYIIKMKIDGTNKSTGTKGTAKSDGKKGASGFSALLGGVSDTDETSGSHAVGGAVSIGALDALLTLQGVDETSGDAAKKARKQAFDLLDQLDRIRIGLLTGELPQSTIQNLVHMIETHRERVTDPELAEILDAIDLRARVELAKLGL